MNESTVFVEGQKSRALNDSGSQFSSISVAWDKKLKLSLWQLHSVLQIEGSGESEVPYLGYVVASLKVPEVSAFDIDVLFLIVPDSVHTAYVPITLVIFHIDMVINLATKAGLENLNKQWNRCAISTKLAMKEAQLINSKDAQIVSQIDNVVKITKDVTLVLFGTIKGKGVTKIPNHYKCVNVTIDDLLNEQCCRDMAMVHQIQILRPGSNKILVILQN